MVECKGGGGGGNSYWYLGIQFLWLQLSISEQTIVQGIKNSLRTSYYNILIAMGKNKFIWFSPHAKTIHWL